MSKTYMGKHLEHAIRACASFGHSKRADKFNDAVEVDWKIYSDAYKKDMVDLALDFGKFLSANFPRIRNSFEIGQYEIQAFLEVKSSTCKDKTLTTKLSRLWKLEKCCMHISCSKNRAKFDWNTSNVIVPKSTKGVQYTKDKPIPLEVAKAAITDLRGKNSEAVNAVTVSTYTGMRVRETTCLKVKDIHFSGGEFGLGWIQIVKGAEGGAKGGKARVIPILDKEAQNALKSIVAEKKPDDYVAAKNNGSKMTPDNVSAMLRDVLKKRHGNTYLHNGCHALRKTFAQRYYDVVRKKFTKKKSVSKTNVVLGHGKNRGVQGIEPYVANIH